MRASRFLLSLALLIALASPAAGASGRDGKIQLRVMTTSVPVRSGPGGSYREVGRVGQGQVFRALARSNDGAWYRVRLNRGTTGWVFSELVWPFEVVEDSELAVAANWMQRVVLGESRLVDSALSLGLSGGGLGPDGLFMARFSYQPSQHYLLEASAGQAAGQTGNIILYRLELLVALWPWHALVPFAAVGAGGATFLPHRNIEVFQTGSDPLVSAGGGLMLQLRGSITLRLDVRHLTLFSPDDTWNALALSGGVMLTF